ncbi:MAG: hypothetical protein ACR2RV_02530 [Verrucomicrobiales bacterium]
MRNPMIAQHTELTPMVFEPDVVSTGKPRQRPPIRHQLVSKGQASERKAEAW